MKTRIIEERFTLNGLSNVDLNFHVLKDWKRPIAPATSDRVEQVLGRNGQIWIDSTINAREFNIPGYFIAESASDLNSYARSLADALVDVHGKPKELILIFTDELSLYYRVRFNSSVDFSRWYDNLKGSFAIPLIADDPYAYEEADATTIDISESGEENTVTSSGTVSTPAKMCFTNNGGAAVDGFTIKVYYESS